MALSIFADALPFTEMQKNYKNWFPNMQLAGMIPNIAYSSSLHWQLYCNKYPDERGVLLDWKMTPENRKDVRVVSSILRPLESFEYPCMIVRKVFDRLIFRKNLLANIPFKFRKYFSEKGKYLFWDKETYSHEKIFNGYLVVSQDEGHITFDEAIKKLNDAIDSGNPNIFFNTGFADSLGHVCRRGDIYSQRLAVYMKSLHDSIEKYNNKYPEEEILIISDHGMSTIVNHVDYPMETLFGKQSKDTYIVYTDSCFMCVWCHDKSLINKIEDYLSTRDEGHLMTDQERTEAQATNPVFGDIIYILREGTCFSNSWFGKALKNPSADGSGMHGFWPEWNARDQIASIVLINSNRKLEERYTYLTANKLINQVMRNEK